MNDYEFISPNGKIHVVKNYELTKHIEVTSVPIINYYRLTPKLCFEGEKHNLYELVLCLKGEMISTIEGKTYITKENEFIIIPKNLMHSSVPHKTYTSSIAINFDASGLKDDLVCSKTKLISSDEISLVKLITKNYYNNISNRHYNSKIEDSSPLKNEYAFKQIIKNSLEILLLLITRDFMNENEKKSFKNYIDDQTSCKKIKEYIEQNISKKLNLKELAEHFSYSESYLSRLFKKTYNETVTNFITKIKIKECAKQLFETDKTISQISDNMGFNNTQYFTKLFKKYYGYTPASFRKESRMTNIINALDITDEIF